MACVVTSVVLSDVISSGTCLAGGHVTPKEWALHLLAESLGAHNHHGYVDVEAADGVPLGVTAVEAVLAWSAAVPGSTLDRPPRFAA